LPPPVKLELDPEPPAPTSRANRVSNFLERLAYLQFERPWYILGAVGVVSILALALATRLTILTGFENLLPESRASVQELRRVAARTSGVSTIFVVLEGSNTAGLRKAADALVPAFKALGPPWVGEAEDGMQDLQRFVEPRAGFYAELESLRKVHDDVDARYQYEVGKAANTNLDLDPDEIPPEITGDRIKKQLDIPDENRWPDGYYQSEDGKTLVVAIRSGVLGSDLDKGSEALRLVQEVVDRVNPKSFDPEVHVGLTGDLVIGIAEYRAITKDLTEVGYTGAALILGVVFLYYLRFRTLLAMTITIAIGLSWTFGATELALGHLNTATGFLFTIVGGNGINFGLIFMARYLEERRMGVSFFPAIRVAHRETWRPTLTAACAAAASYGSLLITEFRGFRDFGAIGGAGMLLCWIATYLSLPAILCVMERVTPLDRTYKGLVGRIRRATEQGVPFGKPFAAVVRRAPRAIALVGVVLSVLGVLATVRYIRSGRQEYMEYDLKNLQSDVKAQAEEQRLIAIAKKITGYIGLDGMAILVDRLDQVAPLESALRARRDAAAEGLRPFKDVHALQDFVPPDQAEKLGLLKDLKDRVLRARKRHFMKDDDWAKIEKYLPPDDVKPFGLADLPAGLARPFTERDGTRGRIVYISPLRDELTSDANYLFRWADSFRETKLPDGSVILGSGRAVIYADMWTAVVDDVPPAVIVSFLATLAIVVVAFRGGQSSITVLIALLIGVGWMAGLLTVVRVKLNFLNFIALPITFGIGVDYAVNIVQRDVRLRDALKVLEGTGGAVILCSLTTLLGYLALVRSVNFAVRSLGVAAVLGEVTCLLAAVLVLPAGLTWARLRAKRRT
jgi:uncharacterized protein